MKRKTLAITAAAAVISLGAAAFAMPSLAHGPGGGYFQGGQAQQGGYGHGMMGGQMGGYGHGMMGGQRGGYGHGMMGGQMGYGPGQGWGRGMAGQGSGDCLGRQAAFGGELSVETVTAMVERRLDHWGNDRIKIGQVVEQEDGTIVAEIVTQDGSLVEKLAFDPKSRHPKRVK